MKRISAGVAALLFSFAAPAWAQSTAAGIWSASSSAPNAPGVCFLNGNSNGYGLTLFASPNAPTVFSLDVTGPFVPSTPTVATFSYGAGLSQTLTGQFISPTDLRITLDGSTQNNFATFLHGFTAGVTMSLLLGYQAVDFSLAGTSAVVGSLGQCTDAENFNSLPAPWRPASEQQAVATPVFTATPVAPAPVAVPGFTATPVSPAPVATPVFTATPVAPAPVATPVFTATPVAPAASPFGADQEQDQQPVAPAPAPQPVTHTWYVLNTQDAACQMAGGNLPSPNDVINIIRQENFIPNVALGKDDGGNTSSADISYVATNGQTIHVLFYRTVGECLAQLNIEIQNGDITPPSQLN